MDTLLTLDLFGFSRGPQSVKHLVMTNCITKLDQLSLPWIKTDFQTEKFGFARSRDFTSDLKHLKHPVDYTTTPELQKCLNRTNKIFSDPDNYLLEQSKLPPGMPLALQFKASVDCDVIANTIKRKLIIFVGKFIFHLLFSTVSYK